DASRALAERLRLVDDRNLRPLRGDRFGCRSPRGPRRLCARDRPLGPAAAEGRGTLHRSQATGDSRLTHTLPPSTANAPRCQSEGRFALFGPAGLIEIEDRALGTHVVGLAVEQTIRNDGAAPRH